MLRCILRHQLAHSAADKAKYLLWQYIIIQGTAKNTCFALIANADVHTARQLKLSMLLKLRHRVYESTVCEKAELYTCILQIRNARHNTCRAFRTITRLCAIGWAVQRGIHKGETAPNRSEANRGAIPLYACFSLELSFSGKKKAEKEQLKYLSIYLDRDSEIWPFRQKQHSSATTCPRQHRTYSITRAYQISFFRGLSRKASPHRVCFAPLTFSVKYSILWDEIKNMLRIIPVRFGFRGSVFQTPKHDLYNLFLDRGILRG